MTYTWILVAVLSQAQASSDPEVIGRYLTYDNCRKQLFYHQKSDPDRKYLCLRRDPV